ncbi:MAG: STAS domain-containing protein [Lysinibacillus sp.]|nr:STAS domain-containing protein [Lysinibacillus sp.]
MNVNVQFREEENILYGMIEGEIDTFTAPALREELEAITIKEKATVELDLSKVTFMDSTGLGVIIAFYKKVLRENANLKLVHLSARLTRLFEITGLSELMDIESTKKVEPANECI